MTKMEKTVPDCDHQSMQNFISDSKWGEEGVIREIRRRVVELMGVPFTALFRASRSGHAGDALPTGCHRDSGGDIAKEEDNREGDT